MNKSNLILGMILLMAILPMVSADVPTTADSCWQGWTVDSFLAENCTYGSDGDLSTQTGMSSPYQRNDLFYNYTFPYGFGNQTNVTFYFLHNDVGSGQYDGTIGCVNKSLQSGDNVPHYITSYFSQQILYGDGEGLHNESVTWTIPIECLRYDNTTTLKVYQGLGDNSEFSQYDIIFSGGGEPSPSPSPSPSPQQQDIVYSVLASSGTGLGVFLEAIRSPLVAIILGIGVILGIVGIVYVLSSTIKNYLGNSIKAK